MPAAASVLPVSPLLPNFVILTPEGKEPLELKSAPYKMKSIRFVTLLLGFIAGTAHAQFQTGIFSSNYAGVMGVTINPASTNYLNNGTDFLLSGGHFSILNNGFYLDPKPITSILSSDVFNAIGAKEPGGGESMNEKFERIFSVHRDLQPKNFVFVDVAAYGPSLLINYRKHSFGITTSIKGMEGTVGMAPALGTFLLKGTMAADLENKTTNMQNVRSGGMFYQDLGFNYSVQIGDGYRSQKRLGFTFHYITGYNSMVFEDLGKTTWSFVGDSTIVVANGNFRYGYAATKIKDVSEVFQKRGSGFGFDIGFTYLKKNKNRPTRMTICPNIRFGGKVREYQDYRWKLGVAVMDIGMINWNTETVNNLFNNTYGPTRNLDNSFYLGLFALDRKFLYDFASMPGSTYLRENKYTQYLATRVNVQFDYHYKNNIYFNFTGTQRVPMANELAMRSANIMSLSARYETMKYEIGIPVSLIEYSYPVMGLNFRYGPLYMGTNHLPEVLGIRNQRGMDLFFGIKFNISNFRGV